MRRTVEERLLSMVSVSPDGCWVWTGAKLEGYGRISYKGKNSAAHRVSYQHFVGPIPPGLDLDHLCDNRPCINPSHLEPVTRQENMLRASRRGRLWQNKKTRCKHDHPLSGENLAVVCGKRQCRTCRRRRGREYRARAAA